VDPGSEGSATGGQEQARYERLKHIVLLAQTLEGDAREALIQRETGDDAGLAADVRELLAGIDADQTLKVSLKVPADTGPEPGPDLSGQDAATATPREYRLLRRLGAGGMGVVYLAERNDGGVVQKVALKLLNATAEASPAMRERFVRERELLARLDHPGIARLLDGGILGDGRPFLAMEYVDGERIDIHAAGLPLDERIELFIKVCDAVAEAHRSLVIHRDIKPANILVDSRGQPRLLDFGIGRMIASDAGSDLTQTGQYALTLAYASPEQLACLPLTTATDVYSLGAVLYQLVCGQAPFSNVDTPAGLFHAIARTDLPPPSRRLVQQGEAGDRKLRIPADIDAIVLKALRKEPGQRYATVLALADDLRSYQQGRPVSARAGERWYRGRRFLRRNAWPLAAAGVVVLSVVGGLLTAILALGQAREQQQVAEQRGEQLQRLVDFQQSMLESVDIDAMGHELTETQQRQVLDVVLRQGLEPELEERLRQGFAQVGAPTIARDALERHIVAHALQRLDRDFADAPLLASDMRQSLAGVLRAIGHYPQAEAEMRRVLKARLALLPGTDADVLSARVDLGQALYLQGELEPAAQAFAQALADSAQLAPMSPLRRAAQAGAARVQSEQGAYAQALERQQALRDAWMAVLPVDDEVLLALRRDFAQTLVRMGRREAAAAELETLLALYQTRYGTESNASLAVMATLGELEFGHHEYERSAELASNVAEARERRLGAEHPDTLRAWGIAATSLVRLADSPESFDLAERLLDRLLSTQGRLLGMGNPATRQFVVDKIRLLSKQERMEDAIALQRRHLEDCRKLLGARHPETLFAMGSLASMLSYRPQTLGEARSIGSQVLALHLDTLGEQHPVYHATLDLMGRIERADGRWAASRDYHAKALDLRASGRGMRDAQTIESASRLYLAYFHLRDQRGMDDVRTRFLDPVIAMDPATLNASMRSVREGALLALEGLWSGGMPTGAGAASARTTR
jgi:tetratricopeptide (TPR) repeat protein/predicted Ser/Thr protein kinase